MAETLLDQVAGAAREAADMAMALWQLGGTGVRKWEKSPGQLVCEVDLAADRLLRERLGAVDPGAAWLSEETADDPVRLRHDRIWLVDPIDGTRDYVRGRPGWAVSVALIEHGAPVIGLLAAPARGEIWMAERGKGAWRNQIPLAASRRSLLSGARVPADQLPKADRDLMAVDKPNSIALRMAMVAADEADLVATVRWGNEWDIAAAMLIAQEAGAVVTDALGRDLRFNRENPTAFGVLCCAPDIHAAAVERLSGRAQELLGRS